MYGPLGKTDRNFCLDCNVIWSCWAVRFFCAVEVGDVGEMKFYMCGGAVNSGLVSYPAGGPLSTGN